MTSVEKFINSVKKITYLYDTADPSYRNLEMKKEAWNQIAKIVGIGTWHECRLKWKNLRDCYSRYTKNLAIAKKLGTAPNPWPWSEHLRFLDKFKNRRRKNPIQFSRRTTSQKIKDSQTVLESSDECLNEPEIVVHEEQQQDSNSKSRKRKSTNSPVTTIKKYPVMESEKESKTMDNGETNSVDVDHLFLSYAKTFKKLPRRMQSKLKLKMATLFAQFELQLDTNTSASIQ